jgi:HK97 family phage major capsid protein
MAQSFGVTRMRLERLGDERDRTNEKIQDLLALAEEETRDLADYEQEQVTKYRTRVGELEDEILALSTDIERAESSKDISRLVRGEEEGDGGTADGVRRWATPRSEGGAVVHRTFAEFARDQLIVSEKFGPKILSLMGGDNQSVRAAAEERLERTLQNVTSSTVAGLINPTHMTEILDIIDRSRPVVDSGRKVPLDRGSMTYPKIGTRPTVELQSAEKTEAGTIAPTVTSATLTASSYLGATNVSWQAVNWSSPDVLQLYFSLAAEAYARQTEEVACDVLEDAAGIGTIGTASGRLGTAGTETFAQWRSAVSAGLQGIYSATGGRHRTNTLYLSAARFFQLATLGSDQTVQLAPIGSMDVGAMTGNFFGLRVVGSYGFDQDVAIIGDSGALLIGENPGSPVEMRVIEPSIAGWEVGLIGAFAAAVFDTNRFYHLGTHL